jgi:hypothetical protein
LEKLAFKQACRRDKRGWGKWQDVKIGEVKRLRARSWKTQCNEILCCGPYEAYPPGRNKFIHSYLPAFRESGVINGTKR